MLSIDFLLMGWLFMVNSDDTFIINNKYAFTAHSKFALPSFISEGPHCIIICLLKC